MTDGALRTPPPTDFSLDDKYLASSGSVVMSGIEALVRLPIDQRRRDVRAGLNTATLISGYRGSPLGSYDMAVERAADLLAEHHVRFMPGVNEDLAATAVLGSQLANTFPGARYDGVLGMWYGKGPGVDRSGDAFRHGNVAGVGRHGGAPTNLAAFRVGRLVVHDPDAVSRLSGARAASVDRRTTVSAAARQAIDRADLPIDAREMVALRVADLTAYQSHAYAMQFLDTVASVARHEPQGNSALTAAIAGGLYRLMAYKDEYEVARLHLLAGFDDAIGRTFGSGARTAFLLQPPSLDRLGVRRKIELGRWFRLVLRALAAGRRLRGTRLDPFGRRAHRRLERGLADEYRTIVQSALEGLTHAAYEDVVSIAGLADRVRGFDHVKERNIDVWRAASAEALRELSTRVQLADARGVSTEE